MRRTAMVFAIGALMLRGGDVGGAQSVDSQWTRAGTFELQQSAEVFVATTLMNTNPSELRPLAGSAALDERLYNAPEDTRLEEIPSYPMLAWERTLAHTSSHLRQVAKILGVTSIVTDSSAACVGITPKPCRAGNYSALVTFSPLEVRGDSASIMFKVMRFPPGRDHGPATTYTFLLHNRFGTWSVVAMRKSASY